MRARYEAHLDREYEALGQRFPAPWGDLFDEMPKGSFVCWHKPTQLFACYLRTSDDKDVWIGGPVYGPTREKAVRAAHQQWKAHCDYHGMKYDLDGK
jgi:hypothetical protein